MAAPVYSGAKSARSQARKEALEAKQVFRPVLTESQTVAKQPQLPANVQELILEALLETLAPKEGVAVAEWRREEHASKRRRKPPQHSRTQEQDPKAELLGHESSMDVDSSDPGTPEILSFLSVGINDLTRALESQIRWGRHVLGDTRALAIPASADEGPKKRKRKHHPRSEPATKRREKSPAPKGLMPSQPGVTPMSEAKEATKEAPEPCAWPDGLMPLLGSGAPRFVRPLDVVFSCQSDLNPSSLVGHLPTTVAAVNGVHAALQLHGMFAAPVKDERASVLDRKVYLVELPKGSEVRIADALGLRRVAALGLSLNATRDTSLLGLLYNHLTPPTASFLIPRVVGPASSLHPPAPEYRQTHIKHLKSTAPVDLRANKALRTEERKRRKEAKKGKKEKRVYVAQD